MKSFIDRIFKAKKQKQQEILDKITNTEITNQATEAAIEAIIEEVEEFPNFIDKNKKD